MSSLNHSREKTAIGLLRWPRYFPRQRVHAVDLNAAQAYVIERLRRHNRFLHGFGVAYGLEVTPGEVTPLGPTVEVSAGYAINPDGDEIFVPQKEIVTIDCVENIAGDCTDLSEVPAADPVIYLVLRYLAQSTCPLPGAPGYCEPDTVCNDSRWQEGYAFACLDELPPPYQTQTDCPTVLDDFEDQKVPAFDALPTGGEVLLACLTLQRDDTGAVSGVVVDMTCRRVLYSTGSLQDVLRCLPTAPAPVPAIVSSVSPPHNAQLGSPPSQVRVIFSKALQAIAVTTASIQVHFKPINTPAPGQPFPGNVSYDPASQTAIFTPAGSPFRGGFSYFVTVRGDEPNAIVDVDNLRLDGDTNGIPGGNFESQFHVEPPFGHHFEHPFDHHFEHPFEHPFDHHFEHPFDHHFEHPFEHGFEHGIAHQFEHGFEHGIAHQFEHGFEHGIAHQFEHAFFPLTPETEPERVEPGPFHVPVEAVPGVTPAIAETLRANNILTADALAEQPVADIAALLTVSKATARKLTKSAKQLPR